MRVPLPVILTRWNSWGWEAPSLPVCGALEVDVMMAVPGFWGQGVYSLRQKMLHGLGLKGSSNRWVWVVINVTRLSCEALSNSPFKVQVDHVDWGKYGSEGVKRLRGLSCPSKNQKAHSRTKENHAKMAPKSIAGGYHLPHDGTLSPDSEWDHFYTPNLHSYTCEPGWVGRQSKSTLHKHPEYPPNSDKLDTNCVVSKNMIFDLSRTWIWTQALSLTIFVTSDKWTINTIYLNSCYLRVVVGIKWDNISNVLSKLPCT